MLRGLSVCVLMLLLVACGSTEIVDPTVAATNTVQVVVAQVTNTALPVATAEPIAVPATSTPLPAPPTFTPPPTQALPTNTPTIAATETPLPEPTLAATEAPVVEGNCLPAAAVADAQSPFRVADGPWVRGSAVSAEIYTGNPANKIIHLGFDVEGGSEFLGDLLDVLDQRQVKATMFIIGSWADNNPEWVAEFAARGHEFANHTRTHGDLAKMTYDEVQAELNYTEAAVQRLSGQTTKPWLRPPFGSRSDVSVQASADAGWSTVIWSGSPDDWRPEFDTEDMCRTLLETSYPGGILYAHTWRPEMPEVIDRYIGTLQTQGYTFVPLSVIMSGTPGNYLIANQ